MDKSAPLSGRPRERVRTKKRRSSSRRRRVIFGLTPERQLAFAAAAVLAVLFGYGVGSLLAPEPDVDPSSSNTEALVSKAGAAAIVGHAAECAAEAGADGGAG